MNIPTPILISATNIAEQVLNRILTHTAVNITTADKEEVKTAVVKASTEVLMNQTNQEPWYKSVIIITQYVTLIASILGLLGISLDPDSQKLIITIVLGLGAVVAPIVTLWARLKAKRGLVVVK